VSSSAGSSAARPSWTPRVTSSLVAPTTRVQVVRDSGTPISRATRSPRGEPLVHRALAPERSAVRADLDQELVRTRARRTTRQGPDGRETSSGRSVLCVPGRVVRRSPRSHARSDRSRRGRPRGARAPAARCTSIRRGGSEFGGRWPWPESSHDPAPRGRRATASSDRVGHDGPRGGACRVEDTRDIQSRSRRPGDMMRHGLPGDRLRGPHGVLHITLNRPPGSTPHRDDWAASHDASTRRRRLHVRAVHLTGAARRSARGRLAAAARRSTGENVAATEAHRRSADGAPGQAAYLRLTKPVIAAINGRRSAWASH